MGNFYTSFTVRAARDKALEAMNGRTRAVSPTLGGFTVVWDAECESQDDRVISRVGQHIASKLAAPVLAVLNHDDDILMYWLFSPEDKVDEYNSAPGYFEGDDVAPKGGDTELLVKTMAPEASREVVDRILRNQKYVFAFERHADLLAALAMPAFAASGYKHISRGNLPDGLVEDDLTFTK